MLASTTLYEAFCFMEIMMDYENMEYEDISFKFVCTNTAQNKDRSWTITGDLLDEETEGMSIKFHCVDFSCTAFAPGYFFDVKGLSYGIIKGILQVRITDDQIYYSQTDLNKQQNEIHFDKVYEVTQFENTIGNTLRPFGATVNKDPYWKTNKSNGRINKEQQ